MCFDFAGARNSFSHMIRSCALELLMFVFTAHCPLHAADLKERLHFEEIDSTQLFAKDHADQLLDVPGEWVAITAETQTNGQGHQDRKWVSSCKGNLYVTFATLYPKNKKSEIDLTIPTVALVVSRTLEELGLNPGIKWVNDVLVKNKKISGCLCEISLSKVPDYGCLLIGIGINANMTEEEALLIPSPATSIFLESGQEIDKEFLLTRLSAHLIDHIQRLLQDGFAAHLEQINNLLLFKGEVVIVQLAQNRLIKGVLMGMDEEGALILDVTQRGVVKIMQGRIIGVESNS